MNCRETEEFIHGYLALDEHGAYNHVLDLELFKPMPQAEGELEDLVATFRRCRREDVVGPNGTWHSMVIG